jgi:hypothetical protein
MPAVFEKMGIRFLYPDNWTLDEDEALHGNSSVTVQSPGGAFWSVVLHPPTTDPAKLAATALAALKEEYVDSEAEPVHEQFGDQTLNGYDMNFFYLDLTSTATIRCFRTADATYLILCQAEDLEYVALSQVFRAITTSFLAEGEAPPI